MGTKKKTKTTAQFDPGAMGVFRGLQPQIGQLFSQYLGGNLLTSPAFQSALSFGSRQASLLGQRNIQNVLLNMAAQGFGGGSMPGFQAAALGRAGRATSGLQANAFWNAFSGAEANRLNVLGQAGAFRPLQTGQTSVEKTSGLGTWLPQAIGAGLSFAMPFMGGGLTSTIGQFAGSGMPAAGLAARAGMPGWLGAVNTPLSPLQTPRGGG